MKVKEIIGHLESKAPLILQEDYDNSGLLIGSVDDEISGVLLCLDINEAILQEAVRRKCNMIISHHPVIFKGMKQLTGKDLTQRIVITAIRENIAIYAIHTNLDNSLKGLNALLMDKIGVKNHRIIVRKENFLSKLVTFAPLDFAGKVRDSLFEAGAGHIGNYDHCSYNITGQGTFRASEHANPFVGERNQLHIEDETRIEVVFPSYLHRRLIVALIKSHPYEEVAYDIYPLSNDYQMAGAGILGELENAMNVIEFLSVVKSITGAGVIRHTAMGNEIIRKVATCTGSGSFLIPDVIGAGADIFLTADLKYHDFFQPEGKLILADIGHYESEQFVKEWIYNALIEKFPTFAILISETNTNPIKYY